MPKSEIEYEIEAKEYISHLDSQAQKLAVKAIDDCLELNRSWRWINTALNKKGYSNWNRWHFGLFFSNNFNASVIETMKREDDAESNDLDDFFSVLDDRKQFIFPQTGVITKIKDDLIEDEQTDDEIPVFYHENGHYEEYEPRKFMYYDLILQGKALELNIPTIKYGLEHNEIPQEYISIYKEALMNYAGDLDD